MDKKKDDIAYSESVNDIMGNPPSSIVKRGNTVILSVFLIFIFFLWLVKYPDIITAPVELTTVNPPVTMVSKITGRIQRLLVKDKEQVTAGQLIAVLETTASVDQVRTLRQLTDTLTRPENISLSSFPLLDGLGEIQNYWGAFCKSLSDYNNFVVNDFYGNKIKSLSEEINGIKAYIGRIEVKEKLYAENQKIEMKKYKRDSVLYTTGVYSESELEKSLQSLLKINIELQQVRLDHSAKSIELAEKKQLLQDYSINRAESREKYISVLNESYLNLIAQLKIWENTYTIVSPVSGVVTFTRYWSENQTVARDEPVLSIIPLEPGDYIGRINLKMTRSGKVNVGQTVNIKLSGFPYLEYGMVRGIIKSKSLVPSGDSYVIELGLPSGLTTLYGKKLEFTQNMQGMAEIMTDNTRLLQKIINPLRYIVSRNRE
jgi:HlyD family secretion protein